MHKDGWLSAVALAVVLILLALFMVVILSPFRTEPKGEYEITVLLPDGTLEAVGLETFLTHVVAAEMPVTFHREALKAQAVAARTYIAAQLDAPKHGEAVVCCDSTCCQAWKSTEDMQAEWGKHYSRYLEKVASAVADTRGMILCHGDAAARTFFFSACGGMTEDVSSVWGGDAAYLVSRPCGDCRHASRYTGAVAYPLTEAASLLDASAEHLADMRVLSYTESGRVGELQVGDHVFPGTEVRTRLGLNSTAFTWLIRGDEIVFLTLGYGHGVGMCQYGADGMGNRGMRFGEILLHYYPGCTIRDFSCIIGV